MSPEPQLTGLAKTFNSVTFTGRANVAKVGHWMLCVLILLISGNICLHHSDCGGREGQGIPHGQVDLLCGTEVKKLVECRHVITALFSFATKFDKAVVQGTGHHGVKVPDGGSHQGSEVWAGNQGGQVASLPEVCRQRWRPGVCREALRSPQAGQSQVRVSRTPIAVKVDFDHGFNFFHPDSLC